MVHSGVISQAYGRISKRWTSQHRRIEGPPTKSCNQPADADFDPAKACSPFPELPICVLQYRFRDDKASGLPAKIGPTIYYLLSKRLFSLAIRVGSATTLYRYHAERCSIAHTPCGMHRTNSHCPWRLRVVFRKSSRRPRKRQLDKNLTRWEEIRVFSLLAPPLKSFFLAQKV